MVIVYTSDEFNKIINDSVFLSEYEEYKTKNCIKFNNLQKFLDSLDINQKYHKISINKNKKYQSEETTIIKNINNLLNKTTSNNIEIIKKEILYSINNAKHLLELIINSLLDKCISQVNYIDLYIIILKDLLSIDKKINIISLIDKKIKCIYIESTQKDLDYDSLCKLNKNIDDSIGLSVLIIKLELNNILENYINPTIQRMFSNIILDNEDICYKYIISMYNIFNILDKSYIEKYKSNLDKLINEKMSKKNKFKIMDILEMV